MVVASSPVRMLIEEHAGEHLNNYRGIVAECAHQKLTLTHAQTGERRERFTARIVNVIDLRNKKGSRPPRKTVVTNTVRALLSNIEKEIAKVAPSPAPTSSDAGVPRPVAAGANHAGSGGVDHSPLGENGNGDGNAAAASEELTSIGNDYVAPSPAPASSDAGEPRPAAAGANHAGSGGVDHPPLGDTDVDIPP